LYSLSGQVGSDLLAGKHSADFAKIQSATFEAKNSKSAEVQEWAMRTEKFLAVPTPELCLQWMSAVFV
jgi:hypothetical protein